jgi:DNA-binding transcriptional ArsR family regulator
MFEMLEKAYEAGAKGRVDSFDVWLKSRGIDSNLFNHRSITLSLQGNVEGTVDRQEELSAIVELIGFYERESKKSDHLFHIPVIGVDGVGKTQLLRVLAVFLEKKKPSLRSKSVDASSFSNVDREAEESQEYLCFLGELDSAKTEVLLVDGCDRDKNIVEALRGLGQHFKRGVLVTAWRSIHWDYLKDSIEEYLPVTKEVRVEPISDGDAVQFVSGAIHLVSHGQFQLKEELATSICDSAAGVPSSMISLLVRSFLEAFLRKKKSVDEESVKAAAKFLALDGLPDRIQKLADHQLLILKHLLLSTDPRGTRPTQLVEILGKDKATISYHLSELSKLRLLESERIGRWVFYRVKHEAAPMIGLRLSQEVDYLA